MERFVSATRRIGAADTREQIAEAIGLLVASLLPSEIAHLPHEVVECMSADPSRIPDCAFELTRAELRLQGSDEDAAFLRDLARAFQLASSRLAGIDARERLRSYQG